MKEQLEANSIIDFQFEPPYSEATSTYAHRIHGFILRSFVLRHSLLRLHVASALSFATDRCPTFCNIIDAPNGTVGNLGLKFIFTLRDLQAEARPTCAFMRSWYVHAGP